MSQARERECEAVPLIPLDVGRVLEDDPEKDVRDLVTSTLCAEAMDDCSVCAAAHASGSDQIQVQWVRFIMTLIVQGSDMLNYR
eukprot:1344317-Amphidinium_carterae.2